MLTAQQLAALLVKRGFTCNDKMPINQTPGQPWCTLLVDNWGLNYGIGTIWGQVTFATAEQCARLPQVYSAPDQIKVWHGAFGGSAEGTTYNGTKRGVGTRLAHHLVRLIAQGRDLQASRDAQGDLMAQLMQELQSLLPAAIKLSPVYSTGPNFYVARHGQQFIDINITEDQFMLVNRSVPLADPDCLSVLAQIIVDHFRTQYTQKIQTTQKRLTRLTQQLAELGEGINQGP